MENGPVDPGAFRILTSPNIEAFILFIYLLLLDVRSDRNFMDADRHGLDQGCHISITALGTRLSYDQKQIFVSPVFRGVL